VRLSDFVSWAVTHRVQHGLDAWNEVGYSKFEASSLCSGSCCLLESKVRSFGTYVLHTRQNFCNTTPDSCLPIHQMCCITNESDTLNMLPPVIHRKPVKIPRKNMIFRSLRKDQESQIPICVDFTHASLVAFALRAS
jgi:hypothetical protein